MAEPVWFSSAACRGMDPDIFFPPKGEDVRPAKRICFTCQHRLTCLEYALANKEKWGVWGGMSERQRRELRRSRRDAQKEARARRLRRREAQG